MWSQGKVRLGPVVVLYCEVWYYNGEGLVQFGDVVVQFHLVTLR